MRLYAAHIVTAAILMATFPLAAQTSAASGHHEPPKPINLQVLPKDISPQDLIATMRGYKEALGVECSFCHAENPQTHRLDFASDTNRHKNKARTMIRMVNEINSKYLVAADGHPPRAERQVTCATCHRGHSHPPPFVASDAKEQGHLASK